MEKKPETQGAAITRLTELRRRKHLRKVRNIVLIVLLVVVLAVYITGVWHKAFNAAGDLMDSIRIAFAPEAGWPARTGIPEILQLEPLAGGFVELGSNDLVVYSSGGSRLRSIQHGYARPAISTGNSRFCVYNRSGNELRIENRSKTLKTKTFDHPVLLAEMSPDGSVAVVTGTKRGLAELTVLDPSLTFRYSWTTTEKEGIPSRIAFAADNRRFAVACLTAENGSLVSGLYFLDIRNDKIVSAESQHGVHALHIQWLNGEKVLVVYPGKTVVYKASTGEELAVFSYDGKPLAGASVCGQNTALLFCQPMTDTPARLVVLDPDLQYLADVQIPAQAHDVELTRKAVYVLRKNSVAAYTLAGEYQWEKSFEAPPLAVLDAKQPLVFYGGQAEVLKDPAQNAGRQKEESA